MAYDLKLAERIRHELEGIPFVEKKMSGGEGFLIHGNMACGVNKNDLIARVDPDRHVALLKKPYVRPFDMTGRRMKGWLVVDADGCKKSKKLHTRIHEGVNYALTLAPK